MKGYKKILIGMIAVSLIIFTVTYKPVQTDAFAGKVAAYAAKKAAQFIAKESVGESIELILKKKVDMTDPLFKQYLGRVDYDMVHIDGKTMLMRNNLGATEKAALKDQVGVVIDRMMYGNNAAWLSWVDWWSVGPVLLIGSVIFSELTDEGYSFIDDVLKQAMIDLGFLTMPQTNFTDSNTNDPVKHYDTPPPTPEPLKNLNYSGVFTSSQDKGMNSANMPINPAQTPFSPYSTFVIEVVPNKPVTSLTDSTNNILFYIELSGTKAMEFDLGTSNTFRNSHGSWGDLIDVYSNNEKIASQVQSTELGKNIPTTHKRKINRVVYSFDILNNSSTMILQSTVDTTVPIYKVSIKGKVRPSNVKVQSIGVATYPSPELTSAGYKVYWDYFTDRVITPPSSRPAPQLKDVKPDNPKDYVKSPVINTSPKTGKPTMAIPVTAIVQDPVQNPVKPDPSGGIIISKPDGTPVTDPDTELPPVTNVPEVRPNPGTGEPEIIPSPGQPAEPATPPATDPVTPTDPDSPTDPDPGTGEPGTGDPGTGTPPDDPNDPEEEKPENVEWEKLKAIPYLFTTKFPFSLPWDAMRAAEAVFGDVPVTSKFKYTVEVPIGDGEPYKLDLSFPPLMDTFGKIFRTGIVIAFDLGLLYAVRKWFGGAS